MWWWLFPFFDSNIYFLAATPKNTFSLYLNPFQFNLGRVRTWPEYTNWLSHTQQSMNTNMYKLDMNMCTSPPHFDPPPLSRTRQIAGGPASVSYTTYPSEP